MEHDQLARYVDELGLPFHFLLRQMIEKRFSEFDIALERH